MNLGYYNEKMIITFSKWKIFIGPRLQYLFMNIWDPCEHASEVEYSKFGFLS